VKDRLSYISQKYIREQCDYVLYYGSDGTYIVHKYILFKYFGYLYCYFMNVAFFVVKLLLLLLQMLVHFA